MVHIKHYTFMIVIVCFVMFLSACNNLNTSGNNNDETKKKTIMPLIMKKTQKNKKRFIGKK